MQIDIRQRDAENLTLELEATRKQNGRLEITVQEYRERIMANDLLVNNYRAMQDENRKLYNQIQDLRGNIRVFLRCRLAAVAAGTHRAFRDIPVCPPAWPPQRCTAARSCAQGPASRHDGRRHGAVRRLR